MRAIWIGLVGLICVAVVLALLPSLPSSGSAPGGMVRDTPQLRPASMPSPGLLVEDTFHLTQGIEADDRLLPVYEGYSVRAEQVIPGVSVAGDGRLRGAPLNAGAYAGVVELCHGTVCLDQRVTVLVHPNVPWEPGNLTFPGKVGVLLDSVIRIKGGPPGVLATFTVTDPGKLPAGVAIGPDGHVGGEPVTAGVSEIPVRICLAGNCAGVVVTLIVV